LVDRCDIVLIATPIRRGNPSSLHQKLIERLNCIQTQKESYDLDLIGDQLAGFIVVGAQDGVQAVI
jgi:multimeric flavodoxin WrbA